MYDLTIIKQNGGAYIDSREVADLIGKRHDHLLRDIDGYLLILEKCNAPNFGDIEFFVKSSYIDARNRKKTCYLLSKMGCELCANKLTGEKGVLFTAAYVAKFNMMEAAERDAEIKSFAKPRLSEFNTAAKNVLNGMAQCYTKPESVMKFLCGVYEPLGIEIASFLETASDYFTVSEIAKRLNIYSETGRPHGHAVSAIISKLGDQTYHTLAIPYGLVGINFRYDNYVVDAVRNWLEENDYPNHVPYQGFEYHLYYDKQLPSFVIEIEIQITF